MKKFNLFVIGGGSAGLRSARTSSMLGAKVGLADFVVPSTNGNTWGLGGTCPNAGCVPKKLFHLSALCKNYMKDAKESGWNMSVKGHNWAMMRDKARFDIEDTNRNIEKYLGSLNVKYFNSYARFIDNNTVELTDVEGKKEIIKADNIIVGAGCRPIIPHQIKNAEELVITSDDLFFLKKSPKKTLVIGAGYIGLETAGLLADLGSEIDIIDKFDIVMNFDREIAGKIKDYMQRTIKFWDYSIILSLEKTKDGRIEAVIQDDKTKETTTQVYDTILSAVGRVPVIGDMGLENLNGVKTNFERLERNENYAINTEKNVFAIGDVASGNLDLTPVAIREGQYLCEHLFGFKEGIVEAIDYSLVPTAIFTPLEYAYCGLSEEAAVKKYGKDNVAIFDATIKPLEWLYYDRYPGKRICFTKVVVEKTKTPSSLKKKFKEKGWVDDGNNFYINKLKYSNSKVLGIHYMGPNAGEIIQGYSVAMQQGLTYGTLIKTVAIHPTVTEAIVNLKEVRQ